MVEVDSFTEDEVDGFCFNIFFDFVGVPVFLMESLLKGGWMAAEDDDPVHHGEPVCCMAFENEGVCGFRVGLVDVVIDFF